ncbi:tRNA (adenosine(37)-N6)-threonylcarbamoyltransferase complex dimerization subunit type 1 TsaB [Tenuifilum osseticum]|uniref:tRNA (adenosine(37)-N6)-threonylcarbamoyltransferase complex dimerization subunit type 1 TsaB n=1 Tax=Tenuifilum osseticum TaxID=3374723 RepID=UPI0034E4D4A7
MAKILCIETGTSACSVAIGDETGVLGVKELFDPKAHSTMLPRLISDVLTAASLTPSQIDAVAVSKGPGSYTGLRIGVSMAKGICYTSGIPLIGVCSLQAMAVGITLSNYNLPADALLCPMIDARRMEVYCALYNSQGEPVSDVRAVIVDENSFAEFLQNQKIVFFGNGSSKCKDVIKSKNAIFIDGFVPSARFMLPIALNAYKNEEFEDTAYFEPFYLKDFVATTPKNKIIPNP